MHRDSIITSDRFRDVYHHRGEERVVRSGSWYEPPANLRHTRRSAYHFLEKSDLVGFRIMRFLYD